MYPNQGKGIEQLLKIAGSRDPKRDWPQIFVPRLSGKPLLLLRHSGRVRANVASAPVAHFDGSTNYLFFVKMRS
jgi:hypothetical protein